MRTEETSSEQAILQLIDVALKEDIRSGDITSEACLSADDMISGRILLKQGGRLAGLSFLQDIFAKVDPEIEVKLLVEEGSEQRAGKILGTVSGPARGVFSAERVALNLLCYASGIATLTAEYVERVEGTPCQILDTRKTLPGLRPLTKYAVRVGGGTNHRKGLDDRFIIKHHHLSFIEKTTRHPILEATRRARAYRADMVVEVEVENLAMVEEALGANADIILLDHMPLPMVRRAVDMIGKKAYVESVGGLTLETIRSIAEAGVDGISIPAITSSPSFLEIGLRF